MRRLFTGIIASWFLAACGANPQASPSGSSSDPPPSGPSSTPPSGSPAPPKCAAASGAERTCTRDGRQGLNVCVNESTVCATTVVSLTFDDALAQQVSAAALLEKHGMRGTFFLNTWRLNRADAENMTAAQANDLQARGHEIGGHTLNHPRLTRLTAHQQHVEICNDRANLIGLGLDVQNFAYPFGDWDSAVRKAVVDCHYNSGRVNGLTDLVAAETLVPQDAFVLRAPRSVLSTNAVEDIEGWVTRAEAQGGWVLLTFHHLCDGCATNSIGAVDFDGLLGWLEQRSGRGTGTARVRDVVGGTTQPAVTWP
jgi:peptidoglycan/xylan/chitin deacetylase (PgdA/CDA1 family)